MLFAFRGRDLLVTSELALPEVKEIDAQGIEAVRTQYLGQLDGRHCYSAELPADVEPGEGYRFANLHMLYGSFDELTHALAGRAVQIVE